MGPPPDDDHTCGWKTRATDLEAKLEETAAKRGEGPTKRAAMERGTLGRKSEKRPPRAGKARKQRPADPAATQAARRKNAELRATRVVSEDVPHKVPHAERTCPKCSSPDLRPVGAGKVSVVLDYVPGYFRRRQHIRETLACTCGEHIVTAPGPDHSVEGARYGDSFRAFVVTSKCADAIPLYRQAKMMTRLGIPISRSTLTDLFHQAARQLAPLARRLLELVAAAEVVQADETSLKMQKPNKRGFVWTFLAEKLIAYVFSGNRSGETPSTVLGASAGTLVVDMYTGYNEVTSTGGRTPAARLAHARRRLFDAPSYAPQARIPPDNNRSESALRVVALGRKNFLFVGHEEAGDNIAGLYSLTATCEANGVEPISYLTDVLGRIGSHPAAALDDLLPHKWRPSG